MLLWVSLEHTVCSKNVFGRRSIFEQENIITKFPSSSVYEGLASPLPNNSRKFKNVHIRSNMSDPRERSQYFILKLASPIFVSLKKYQQVMPATWSIYN